MSLDKHVQIEQLCRQARILPVITFHCEEHILPLADALAAGGLTTLEVTLRSEYGLAAIQLLTEQRPNLCIGAGTVLNPQMLEACVQAGARFLVAPGITQELLLAAQDSPIPLLPGVSTASEIMQALALDYQCFKLFPAEASGGVAALKALAGPFPQVRFCPTGGVNAHNLAQYIALPNVFCVGGSWMMESEAIKQADWSRVQQATQAALRCFGSPV